MVVIALAYGAKLVVGSGILYDGYFFVSGISDIQHRVSCKTLIFCTIWGSILIVATEIQEPVRL